MTARVSDPHGTIYAFDYSNPHPDPINNGWIYYPTYVEDKNGNRLTLADTTAAHQQFTLTDDVGRTALYINGFGSTGDTVSVSGYAQPYTMTWDPGNTQLTPINVDVNYISSVPASTSFCIASGSGPLPSVGKGITMITLPNQQAYEFQYNPEGYLQQITYPGGGYVQYQWNTFDDDHYEEYQLVPTPFANGGSWGNSATCPYRRGSYNLSQRTVSYDGKTVALTQTYNYTTHWPSAYSITWDAKTTTVITTDNVTGLSFATVYNYVPGGSYFVTSRLDQANFSVAPVARLEAEVDTYSNTSTSNTPLVAVKETWFNNLERFCSISIENGSLISGAFTTWAWPTILADQKNYDYGLLNANSCGSGVSPGDTSGLPTPTQETAYNYQSFTPSPFLYPATNQGIPVNPPLSGLLDAPCEIVSSAQGGMIGETDYYYDGGTALCAAVGAPNTVSLSSTNHDEVNYGPTGSAARGNITQIVRHCFIGSATCSSGNPTTTIAYDETGKISSITDACGNAACADVNGSNHTTTYSYTDSPSGSNSAGNSNAYLTSVTDPLGHQRTAKYKYTTGQISSSTDANKQTTSYLYNDPLNRLTEVDFPDQGKTDFNYNDPALAVTSTKLASTDNSEPTIVTITTADSMGHVLNSNTANGAIEVDTTFTGLGQVASVTNPYSSGATPVNTVYSYDALGRKTQKQNPDLTIQQWCYDNNPTSGQEVCKPLGSKSNFSWVDYSDEAGNSWQIANDAFGRTVQVLENASYSSVSANVARASIRPCGAACRPAPSTTGLLTAYSYDALSNLLQVNQFGNAGSDIARNRSFTYDSLSHLLTSQNPETGTICYGQWSGGSVGSGSCDNGYDANGNLSYKTDARGISTAYSYDALNRLASKTYSDGSPIAAFGYDGFNESGTPLNNLGLNSQNSVGRMSIQSNEQGAGVVYSYDAMGRVVEQYDVVPSTPQMGWIPISATYDLAGDLLSLTYPDGRMISQTLDSAGRLSSVNSTGWSNAPTTPLAYLTVSSYDAANHVTGASFGNGVQFNASYNNRLQPSGLSYVNPLSGGVYWGRGYTWTPNGNLSQTTDQVLGTNRQFGYDSLNRLTSAQDVGVSGGLNEIYSYDSFGNIEQSGNFGFTTTYTASNQLYGYSYDAAGNLLSDGLSNSMAYDANEQIVMLNGITYTYLPSGDRIAKSGSNATGYFEFSGKPVARYSGGQWTDLISGPNGLIAEVTGSGQPVYRMLDHLGTEIGQLDYQGNLLSSVDYAPFGQSFNGSDQDPYKFTGKERDAESGLDYFGARYYGSNMGRMMSPDDFVNDTHTSDPQSWNLYAYARNNPLRYIDPTGEIVENTDDPNHKLTNAQMSAIAKDLQQKTGLSSIAFDKNGQLGYDKDETANGGSAGLRDQITSAIDSQANVFKLADYSNDPKLNFMDSDAGSMNANSGQTTYNVRIDFADYANAAGQSDKQAMAAFSLGLGVSHEIDHKFPVYNPRDTGPGGVIDNVNVFQRQLGLATRDINVHNITCPSGTCSIPFHDPGGKERTLRWQLENSRR
ncbi:RHS repeat domain-containing protein [Granulicella paludicola]|uniref:RHS repeat domain-containing protein n=1 Tax=Granulicella paludicola TaxID=474951 RepID=UPI0021DF464D|nr:RHS repeat-associated core domain-containing protein [Granulicella paludicola]